MEQEKRILNHSLAAPAVVGELGCINGTKRGATIRASVDSELWKLDQNCIVDVSEEDRRLFVSKANSKQFVSLLRNSQRSKSTQNTIKEHVSEDELGSDAFGVLMWFYQLAGTMLSVSSPLTYVDGSAVAYSLISFFVNSKTSTDAASGIASQSTSVASSSEKSAAESSKFQFCVDKTFTTSQVYLTTFMYYVLWALIMTALARKRVWKFTRNVLCFMLCRLLQVLEMIAGFLSKNTTSPFSMMRQKFLDRQTVEIEIRGPVLLKWFITCFSAVATLMMQGTSCIQLDGMADSNIGGNWIYDGRVACYSNSGIVSGRWQVASAIGVAVVLIAPALLLRIMLRIARLEKSQRTQLQETLLEAYSGAHPPSACHWKVIM
jgi:hypothetical protein